MKPVFWIPISAMTAAMSCYVVAQPPQLMLASDYRASIEANQYYASEKYDGIRAFWNGQSLITRSGKTLNPPAWFVLGFPEMPLDGELWMGRGQFQRLTQTVLDQEPNDAEWGQVRYMVFDLPMEPSNFAMRQALLRQVIDGSSATYLAPAHQKLIQDDAELEAFYQATIAQGGEGIMLHHINSLYINGRSAMLQKRKPFADSEATVIGYTQGKGKFKGMLGALIVQMPSGQVFKIGSGFSVDERQSPPPIGSTVTYRYNGHTDGGLPRFARFIRLRPQE
ncbi:DNA ligase [Vibrio stylophorae]|uniref:DNA ligase n=1 Tax=Vibrio stylophorae TaxID=659351 RepID=A0ABN8DWG7_9VIBR|nr:DNA ligase [Vibrio stylophorae]CAH0535668.1 DNA ligase [Vibrio stylophorae]